MVTLLGFSGRPSWRHVLTNVMQRGVRTHITKGCHRARETTLPRRASIWANSSQTTLFKTSPSHCICILGPQKGDVAKTKAPILGVRSRMIESSRFENRQESVLAQASLSLLPTPSQQINVRLLELLLKWANRVHSGSPNERETATQSKQSLECGAPWQRCCSLLHLLRNPTPVDRSLSLLP